MSNLNPEQFQIEHTTSPLAYPEALGPVQRVVIRHPEATTGVEKPENYMDDTQTIINRSKTGKQLKNPKVEKTPGAGSNSAGFVDYEKHGDAIHIHYMRTRNHLQGSGIAQKALETMISSNKPSSINFGKMMEPEVGHIKQKIEKNHPDIDVRGKVWYR
jgi:hypothetical protein